MGASGEEQSVRSAIACVVCGMEATAIDINDDGTESGFCEVHAPDHLKAIAAEMAHWMGPRGTRRFFRRRPS